MKKYIKYSTVIFLFLYVSCNSFRTSSHKEEREYLREIKKLEKEYESPSWIQRKEAVKKCADYPSERTMNLLLKASDDTHTSIQADAMIGLSAYKNDIAFNRLCSAAEDRNRSDIVRISALKGLSEYKSEKAANVFISAITDENNLIRCEAYTGLLNIKDRKIENISTEYILTGLNDSSVSVQMAVLDNIRIKNPLIYKPLKDFVISTENHHKNTMMIKVLKNLEGYEIDEELEKALRTLLVNNNMDIRLSALRVLKSRQKVKK